MSVGKNITVATIRCTVRKWRSSNDDQQPKCSDDDQQPRARLRQCLVNVPRRTHLMIEL